MAVHRPIRLPAADFSEWPLPIATIKGLSAMRIHGETREAIHFRRIPSHRFSHPDAPGGLMYLAFDLEACLWECFGDSILEPTPIISRSVWVHRRVSRITSSATLRLCDLTNLKTRSSLKVDLSALKHNNLGVPQAWGLALQTHPEQIDGLYYSSRFTGNRCVALFERQDLAATLEAEPMEDLLNLPPANLFLEENRIALV